MKRHIHLLPFVHHWEMEKMEEENPDRKLLSYEKITGRDGFDSPGRQPSY